MPRTKLVVTLNANLVKNLDHLVAEKLARLAKARFARECARLDPREEKALAEEGLTESTETCHLR